MKPSTYDIPKDLYLRNKQAFEEILDARYFEMLRLRVEDELTFSAIAKFYGLTTERIRQILGKTYHILEQAGYVGKRTIIK
ncbi:sigma factor-like helix-turn-helix DNA-binding protein [Aquimarina sp. 2201CG14-23]|uniref:sigma factor-like helix-turn-helix DNA-binding protein n=1 Tax=Aquimarina mycalae TaxID=3040073 RepID=UPI002477FCA2|nr:sigma factor-like helix-turn-helix DNA-binding protein [Aquimarina sp. 2201CG14-23]MDH7448451.1 sigma factor-like helix-turn-helix DNA-binding protein [Aquimarina sp. 2201CG14-23]